MPVGQREEDDVVAGEGLGRRVGEHAVGQRGEVRVDAAEPLPRRGSRRDGADLEVGVPEQEPQELTPGVPARTRDCRPLPCA